MKKNFSMKKLYYSISEVSKITELEQYVLRYWETEFEQLRPAKNLAGNRIYTNKDIKLILHIKKLLRDEKYTIEGAKKLLKNYNTKDEAQPSEKQPLRQTHMQLEPSKKVFSSSELSLFNSQDNNMRQRNDSLAEENERLLNDLKELKSFLGDLLNEIK